MRRLSRERERVYSVRGSRCAGKTHTGFGFADYWMDDALIKKGIRFGIGSESAGRKASSWVLWTNGGADYSVYLACRELGKFIHTSFHDKGRWHTGFHKERFPAMFVRGHQPESRFAGQWDRPTEFSPGWIMAAQIYTSLRAMWGNIIAKPKGMVWVPPPASDQQRRTAFTGRDTRR